MAVQSTYNTTQAAAVAGARATMIGATVISRNVETAAIGFGKPVAQGTAEKGVIAFAGTGFVGITLLDRSAAGDNDTFRVGDSARIMTKGDVWVNASLAVAAGNPVYLTTAGAFTNVVGTDNVAIAGARWDTSTTAAGLAVIRLG